MGVWRELYSQPRRSELHEGADLRSRKPTLRRDGVDRQRDVYRTATGSSTGCPVHARRPDRRTTVSHRPLSDPEHGQPLRQSISKHEGCSTDAEKVAFVERCGNHHLDRQQTGTLCHAGRSNSHANEISANPGAPRGDIVPHCAGCRQMVLAGGQRDRAALCAPRGRSLVGLAAFPAILSGRHQPKSFR